MNRTAIVSSTLPTLDVPVSPRRKTENDPAVDRSFMEDSDSHAQKVLIHSIASDDTALMAALETPDPLEHVSHQDPNLGTPRRDPTTATDNEVLIDESAGHGQKVLIHVIGSMPEDNEENKKTTIPVEDAVEGEEEEEQKREVRREAERGAERT